MFFKTWNIECFRLTSALIFLGIIMMTEESREGHNSLRVTLCMCCHTASLRQISSVRKISPDEDYWKLVPGHSWSLLWASFISADFNLYSFTTINCNNEYNSFSESYGSFLQIIDPEGGLGGLWTQVITWINNSATRRAGKYMRRNGFGGNMSSVLNTLSRGAWETSRWKCPISIYKHGMEERGLSQS